MRCHTKRLTTGPSGLQHFGDIFARHDRLSSTTRWRNTRLGTTHRLPITKRTNRISSSICVGRLGDSTCASWASGHDATVFHGSSRRLACELESVARSTYSRRQAPVGAGRLGVLGTRWSRGFAGPSFVAGLGVRRAGGDIVGVLAKTPVSCKVQCSKYALLTNPCRIAPPT